ncbi:MAG: hypothetical protein QME90_16055 [Thermodesulfobacteriota bacterium]|nr:hypothetical protein [Thermodesulfobacteriota bacterium]
MWKNYNKGIGYLTSENQTSKGYTLGPLPWNEEVLRRAYFQNFVETRKAIQEHPGFPVHCDLSDLQLSLSIFVSSVFDLLDSIEAFRIESQVTQFWTCPSRDRFEKQELAIRRGIFSAATSAIALVDHSRRVSRRANIPEYQARVYATFANNEMHRFVHSLRKCISHIRMIEADWQVKWDATGKSTKFKMRQETLLTFSEWHSLAKAFISQHPEGIDVEILFKNYQAHVKDFHNWFYAEVEKVLEPQLSEYREYERILNRFDVEAWWNMIFKQVVMVKRLDPYKYLDRFLTKQELDEVFSLPMRSQKQVDRIIEILDEYKACDKDLRETIYLAFGVNF